MEWRAEAPIRLPARRLHSGYLAGSFALIASPMLSVTPRLKPLQEQVLVITGASSGIGLVTARAAARQGARLVLVGLGEESLRQLADEINQGPGQAIAI